MVHPLLCIVFALACLTTVAHSACSGGYYNNLPCASTTRYKVDTQGSCGCGNNQQNTPFSWQVNKYTAAGSSGFFNPSNPSTSWCGSGCGACYNITPTGDCPTGGNCVRSYKSIVVMVTNLCPYSGNAEWCPLPNTNNRYGYQWHFDLNEDAVASFGWDNPAVTFKQVPCDGNTNTPTCAEAAQCNSQCTPAINRNCAAGQSPTTAAASGTTTTKSSTTTSQSGTSSAATSVSSTTSAPTCTAGTVTCPCAAGTCNAGLSCISNVCVNPGDALKGFAASLSPSSLLVFALLLFGAFLF